MRVRIPSGPFSQWYEEKFRLRREGRDISSSNLTLVRCSPILSWTECPTLRFFANGPALAGPFVFSEQVSADLAYGALTTVKDIGWALTAVGLPKGASAPVALSILKPTIALFFPSTANRNRPEGSMVGPPKTELEAKGEPAIGVSAPEFPFRGSKKVVR